MSPTRSETLFLCLQALPQDPFKEHNVTPASQRLANIVARYISQKNTSGVSGSWLKHRQLCTLLDEEFDAVFGPEGLNALAELGELPMPSENNIVNEVLEKVKLWLPEKAGGKKARAKQWSGSRAKDIHDLVSDKIHPSYHPTVYRKVCASPSPHANYVSQFRLANLSRLGSLVAIVC